MPYPIMEWPPPPTAWPLAATDVHVWAVPLDSAPPALPQLAATLASEERQRAARFRFPRDRDRFIAGRGLLRAILGRYLDLDPAEVEFAYGPHGKPFLAPTKLPGPSDQPRPRPRSSPDPSAYDDQNQDQTKQRTNPPSDSPPLQFNLAHSDTLALLAVTRLDRVGVDVEHIRVLPDARQLVARFFSLRENELYQNLSASQRPAAFFNLWTRKEAWLKATGEGIAHSLHLVEVSFLPGEPARFLALPPGSSEPAAWALHDLNPAPGFAAALAIPAGPSRLRCWRWNQGTG